MHEITFEEAQEVGGAFSFTNWGWGQVLGAALSYAWNATISGQVDYAGLAESQGSNYNTVGA